MKLQSITDRYKILRPGYSVLDCGASPGGWTQIACRNVRPDVEYAKSMQKIVDERSPLPPIRPVAPKDEICGHLDENIEEIDYGSWSTHKHSSKGVVISVDLKPIAPLPGAILLDNRSLFDNDTKDMILQCLGDRNLDSVLSDMLPNMTGQKGADHWNSIELVRDLAHSLGSLRLRNGGTGVFKILMGSEEQLLKEELRGLFANVVTSKPDASRSTSKEIYFVCLGFKKEIK